MEKVKRKCYCGYEWVSRRSDPKACPRCKGRLDAPWIDKRIEEGVIVYFRRQQ